MTSLVKNAAWRLASSVALMAVSLLTVPVFARILGMEDWGLLSLFQAAIAPFALLDFGTGTATVKYIAEEIGRGRREEATRTFQSTLAFTLLVGVAGATALVVGAQWLATSVFLVAPARQASATAGFRLMGLQWLLAGFSAACSGVLTAHGLYGRASRLRTLQGIATGAAGIAAVFAHGGLLAVVGAQISITAVMAALWFRAAAQTMPGIRALPRWHTGPLRRSLSFGLWQTLGGIGGLLGQWSDRYILGALFSASAVGFYAIALGITTTAYGTVHEMGEVLFPSTSHRLGAGELEDARRISLQAGWLLSGVFAAACAALGAIGSDFIGLWVSPGAAQVAGPVLRILLSTGILGMAITGPYFFCLGLGHSRILALSSLLTGVVVLTLSLSLGPSLGLPGVAWATVGGALSQWLVLLHIGRSVYRPAISLRDFALQVWSPSCIGLALLWGLSVLHDRFFLARTWPLLFMEGLCFALIALGAQLSANELLPGGPARRRLIGILLAPLRARIRASMGLGGEG